MLNKKTADFQSRESDYTVTDVSYVELPEKVTCLIDAGSVLGAFAFLVMLLIPGAVEGGNYILALILIVIFILCAKLSLREEDKRK